LKLVTMAPFATRKTRIVCISDTHNQTPKLPAGDILIHAGDLTNQGSYSELKKTVEWLEKTDFEAKIVVAGMHACLPPMHATYIHDGR
jgi:3',5'-cyclic AMP phosphodiesterase CpdA